jgi:excinuclease ABC subunit C
MAIWDLKHQISRLPEQPGVYIYFNGSGETIYVGRARVLRQRVKTYLSAQGASPKTAALVKDVTRLEVIVTDSLVEALALENNLIKQRIPRFNILLRDDKNYPYLQVTTTEAFPRVLVARRVSRDGNVYAGPFLPAALARKTMSLTHRLFGIRSCNEVINGKRGRACLEYDIKRCLAPCVESICSQTEYSEAVQRTQMFLEGRNEELLTDLNAQMRSASSAERYEGAAQYRDTIRTIETLRDRQQKMASPRLGERDVFGIKVGSSGGLIQIFQVRGGRVIERIELVADEPEEGMTQAAELLRAGLQQFYEARRAPTEVHLPLELDDQEEIETWLSGRSGHRVRIRVPKRGDKRGLVELATRNAKLSYDSQFGVDARRFGVALEELRDCLALKVTPRRLECFDISTLHGAETVGALVVNEDGRMLRRDYRKFRIRGDRRKSLGGSDDFASIEEVVIRRYRRLLEQGGPFPDLVIVDGGVGQLSAAYKAFDQLGLSNLEAIGIAKKEELLITRDRRLPIALPRDSAALQLVQRIRDEAHRFAVTFHRRSRTKRDFSSELDLVTGVGPKRRQALLERFGSVKNIGRATNEELVPIVGTNVARLIIDYFSERVSNK